MLFSKTSWKKNWQIKVWLMGMKQDIWPFFISFTFLFLFFFTNNFIETFIQILILRWKSLVDVEGLNISGKWGKKLISPQSAFLVLPENSPYLKKNKTKQNSHVIKIYPPLGLKYAAYLSWMLTAERNERLSDFCLTFVVDVFFCYCCCHADGCVFMCEG